MPRRPSATHRWLTAATWPVGVGLTSWDYLWRTTVLHRRELEAELIGAHVPPPYPEDVDDDELQPAESGFGPLFHRRYTMRLRDVALAPEELMGKLRVDVNAAAPTKFARFQRVLGGSAVLSEGDEYVVRMPGPWDGPVRVVVATPRRFRLATLVGHLEAGQIEFRVQPRNGDGEIGFAIESWARSSGRYSDMLYQHTRMAKEIQLHMWVSFLEGVARLSGGQITGGVDIDTRRIERPYP